MREANVQIFNVSKLVYMILQKHSMFLVGGSKQEKSLWEHIQDVTAPVTLENRGRSPISKLSKARVQKNVHPKFGDHSKQYRPTNITIYLELLGASYNKTRPHNITTKS